MHYVREELLEEELQYEAWNEEAWLANEEFWENLQIAGESVADYEVMLDDDDDYYGDPEDYLWG